MNVKTENVPCGRFFVTNDPPPGNIFVMRVVPAMHNDWEGLCQNIDTENYWHIKGGYYVRLLREDEHDGNHFYF